MRIIQPTGPFLCPTCAQRRRSSLRYCERNAHQLLPECPEHHIPSGGPTGASWRAATPPLATMPRDAEPGAESGGPSSTTTNPAGPCRPGSSPSGPSARASRGSSKTDRSSEEALWAFPRSDNLGEWCLLGVNLGYDGDTIAAIYGQPAGAYYGLPRQWREVIAQGRLILGLADGLLDAAR